MKRIATYLLLIVLLGVVSVAAFYCGGCAGFAQGYNFVLAENAPNEATTSVIVISMLKKNKIDAAVDFLEARLDGAIIRHWYHLQNPPSFLGIRFYDKSRLFDESSTRIMIKACKYRKENPHDTDNNTHERIKTVLNYYLKR